MNTFHPISKEKFRLMRIARSIRDIKNDLHLKGVWPEVNGMSAAELQKQLGLLKYLFRHRHIAYSLVRGRTVAEIESGNPLKKKSWDLINVFRLELLEQIATYYRDMTECLMEDNKKKDRDVIRFQQIKHVWNIFLNDLNGDQTDSVMGLMNAMSFIIDGPAVPELELIGHGEDQMLLDIPDDFEDYPYGCMADFDDPEAPLPDEVIDESTVNSLVLSIIKDGLDRFAEDEHIIELTDEVIFIGTPEGIRIDAKPLEPLKCACCDGTAWHCTCPEFCYPECAVCHQGNGNCICHVHSDMSCTIAQDCIQCQCDVCIGNCLCEQCKFGCSPECAEYGMHPCICRPRKDCPLHLKATIIRTGKFAEQLEVAAHACVSGPCEDCEENKCPFM